jgi:hypothetical protein
MAAALMTQWLFNFVIAKLTPIMLTNITYGTFLLFGSCCIMMVVYTVFCIPETKGVTLERLHLLFEGGIIKGAVRDTVPRLARGRLLQGSGREDQEVDVDDEESMKGKGKSVSSHVEHR